MKKASAFEIVAARCWNLLNEGKPFTPIFVLGVYALYRLPEWGDLAFWASFGVGLLLALPLFALYFIYDFPLFLRNYLWMPVAAALLLWRDLPLDLPLYGTAIGLFFFFTVFFWGTFYYRMRIGTTWWNFTRFWKLVLKNSDSTSGNAQEQLPKSLLLLFVIELAAGPWRDSGPSSLQKLPWADYAWFIAGTWLFAWVLHRYLFDWKPREIKGRTGNADVPAGGVSRKVIVLVIDGMRKERFEEADAPWLKSMRNQGTAYTMMETVYPARTVVCFSSMFTGTYPREHGITSNMVWRLGIRVESIFDSLRTVRKKGRLLGIAHLIDSMGDDVESITAVMHNDKADRYIMERAKTIMSEQNPDLLVVQFIGTDQTGHSRGVLYDEYLHKINEADTLCREFHEWLTAEGYAEDATFIVCADHGQADGIGGHGHLDEGERYVPFFLFGHGIREGVKVEDKHSLVSVAPTIAYLLGAPYPSHSRGPVLTEAIEAERKRRGASEHDNASMPESAVKV
jgi:hypothetical protein